MFGVTLWGGVWSIVIALLLYRVFNILGVTELRNSIGAIFVIGPVEELAKLSALFSAYFINKGNGGKMVVPQPFIEQG
jgi:RsiW-degrading membrane proteinase PrsW (M82 family)